MIRRLTLALDDRLGTAHFIRKALRKAFPDHWSFMLGEIALYCFVVLFATGIYLGFFFNASAETHTYSGSYLSLRGMPMSGAYASVLRLSLDTRAGLLLRQIHHWAALVFVAAIAVHMSRIFFTGAFRRPRELNWILGVLLLILALAAGFTGYSLPDDALSGTALRIAYSVLISIPVVGTDLAYLLFGGAFPATQTAGRLFFLHVVILPAAIVAAVALHLAIIWRQKHTQYRGRGRTENNVVGSPIWPNYAMKSIGLLFAVAAILTVLGAFVQINPIWLYGPYDPANVSVPAQPDWYIGFLEGSLRLGPAWDWHILKHTIPSAFFSGVLPMIVFFSVFFAWPFLERAVTHDGEAHHLLDHPSDAPLRTAIGAGVMALLMVLTLAGGDDIEAKVVGISIELLASFYRIMLVILPLVVGLVTFEIARELRARRYTLPASDASILISRAASGGFAEQPAENAPPRL
jgi:ubiquinol-cytochrome c reductase cytochrome b subunit